MTAHLLTDQELIDRLRAKYWHDAEISEVVERFAALLVGVRELADASEKARAGYGDNAGVRTDYPEEMF